MTVTDVDGKKKVIDRRNSSSSSAALLLMIVCSKHPLFGLTVYFDKSDTPAINGWLVGQ